MTSGSSSRRRSTSRCPPADDRSGRRHPTELMSQRIADVFVGMGWRSPRDLVEAEWFLRRAQLRRRPSGPPDAGHLLRRPADRSGAAHPHSGAGPGPPLGVRAALHRLSRRFSARTSWTQRTCRPSTRWRGSRSTKGITRWPTCAGTLDRLASRNLPVRTSRRACAVLHPERRDGPALLRLPRRDPACRACKGTGAGSEVGRLRDGEPERPSRACGVIETYSGFAFQHGHRPGLMFPDRGLGHAEGHDRGDVRFTAQFGMEI